MNTTVLNLKRNRNAKDLEMKLDESIYYCLNILMKRHTELITPEIEAVFAKNMFIKSNTAAFIHVTHFLFDILDPKDCKKRFYWPIFDKNAENSYRSSVVEYINQLIEKQKLKMSKIKMHMVVLPGGVKFMEFLLNIINYVLNVELDRSKARKDVSLNLEEAKNIHKQLMELNQKLDMSIKRDVVEINKKTSIIRNFIEQNIFTCNGYNVLESFSPKEFLCIWHELNKYQYQEFKAQDEKMDEVFETTTKAFQEFSKMMEIKKYEIFYNDVNVTDLAAFLKNHFNENYGVSLEINLSSSSIAQQRNDILEKKFSFKNLLEILEFVIPDIAKTIQGFRFENPEIVRYETKEIVKVQNQVNELTTKVEDYHTKYYENKGSPKIPNGDGAVGGFVESKYKRLLLLTPKIHFDVSERCVRDPRIVTRNTRLPLMQDDNNDNLNRTQLLRILTPKKMPTSIKKKKAEESIDISKQNETGVFNKPTTKRFNAQEILKRATNIGRHKSGLNITRNPQLSSTMRSPDRNSNLSIISGISRISSISPIISEENGFNYGNIMLSKQFPENKYMQKAIRVHQNIQSPIASTTQLYEETATVSPDSIIYNQRTSINSVIHLSRSDLKATPEIKHKASSIHNSPSGKLDAIALHSNIQSIPKITVTEDSSYLTVNDEIAIESQFSSIFSDFMD